MTRLGLVFTLYLSQGIATSFLVLGLPAVLRARGVALELLWVASLPVAVYAIKFLWAPLADRYWWPSLGRRRSWLLPAAVALAGAFVLLALMPPDRTVVGAGVALIGIALAASTMDIATDGYAVETLRDSERGIGNGLQSAGLASGGLLGRGVVLWLIGRLGWTAALMLTAAIILLAALPGLVRREPTLPAALAERARRGEVGLRQFFQRPEYPLILGLALLTGLCYFLLGPILGPFLIDAGLPLGRTGVLQGGLGTLAGIAGALAGGASVNRLGFIGAFRMVLTGAAVVALGSAFIAGQGFRSGGALSVVVVAVNLVTGGVFAVFYANVMRWCSAAQAATDVTMISSAFSAMAVVGGGLAPLLASRLGYPGHFLVVTAVSVATAIGVGVVGRKIPVHGLESSRS